MRRDTSRRIAALLAAVVVIAAAGGAALAQDASFQVAQFVVCSAVQNHEPVNVIDVFPVETERVFCFLEARDVRQDTQVQIVWYHQDAEMARVTLALGQGERWRTYSSKLVNGLAGNWKVYLQDQGGAILSEVQFVVQ